MCDTMPCDDAVELFDDVKTGSARFRDLAVGKMGVGYRLSRFNGIFPTYIRCEGVKSLSYSVTADSPIAGAVSYYGIACCTTQCECD